MLSINIKGKKLYWLFTVRGRSAAPAAVSRGKILCGNLSIVFAFPTNDAISINLPLFVVRHIHECLYLFIVILFGWRASGGGSGYTGF